MSRCLLRKTKERMGAGTGFLSLIREEEKKKNMFLEIKWA
jgi:hypothetical protein